MSKTDEARPRILVADDSKVMRMSARKILEEDFELVMVPDGIGAWETLQEDSEIVTLFSDVGMPGLDGYQLLERIRQSDEPRIRELPVIVVTGNDDESARDKALNLGATDFITKPFDRAQLLARARSHATLDRMRRVNTELEATSTRDPVTGLGNSRHFETRLRETRAWALRHELPMAVIRLDLLDLDKLVRAHGKRVAVDVLREVAGKLSATLREEDVIARVGNGRFAVVCPECESEGARTLAERITQAMSEDRFGGDQALELAVAVGVYVPGGQESEGLEAIYNAAQQAVKKAVAQGPGSVVLLPAAGGRKQAVRELEDTVVARFEKMLSRLPRASAERVLDRLRATLGE